MKHPSSPLGSDGTRELETNQDDRKLDVKSDVSDTEICSNGDRESDGSNDECTDEEAIQRLQDLQYQMQLAVKSNLECQEAAGKVRQAELPAEDIVDNEVRQNLAIDFNFEENEDEDEDEESKGEDFVVEEIDNVQVHDTESNSCPVKQHILPTTGLIDHNTLEEVTTNNEEIPQESSSHSQMIGSDDLRSSPVIVSMPSQDEEVTVTYVPKKQLKASCSQVIVIIVKYERKVS